MNGNIYDKTVTFQLNDNYLNHKLMNETTIICMKQQLINSKNTLCWIKV